MLWFKQWRIHKTEWHSSCVFCSLFLLNRTVTSHSLQKKVTFLQHTRRLARVKSWTVGFLKRSFSTAHRTLSFCVIEGLCCVRGNQWLVMLGRCWWGTNLLQPATWTAGLAWSWFFLCYYQWIFNLCKVHHHIGFQFGQFFGRFMV